MTAGTVHYDCSHAHITGKGYVWTEAEWNAVLSGRVKDRVFDARGRQLLSEIAGAVLDTGFDPALLENILETGERVKEWQVGEAIAEVYLETHRECLFPWPLSWDQRKPGSSLPGADLVGVAVGVGQERLAFGEVKTSSESKYPPSVMHGEHGLKRQIEDLLGGATIRNMLMQYLMVRVQHQASEQPWKAAFQRYFNDPTDVYVVGVLVRDVKPKVEDLQVRVKAISKIGTCKTGIELVSLYLPEGSLGEVVPRLEAIEKGGVDAW